MKEEIMNSGRMPAYDTKPFDGGNIASVPSDVLIGHDNTCTENQRQPLNGNKCGHDKNSFKKPEFLKKGGRRPHCLEEAKRRIELAIQNNFQFESLKEIFYHKAGSTSETGNRRATSRKRRSESVEGIFSLALPMLLQTLNLHKMACGHYDNRQHFHFYDYTYIQNGTDQNSSRVKREMAVLQFHGIINVNTIRELTNDGVFRTVGVQIEFTDKIFSMLNLMDEFLDDRETSMKMFHEKKAKLDKKRQKKSIYRKPSFSSKDKKLTKGLQSLTEKLTNPYKPQQSGRGREINALYTKLLAEGYTAPEAAEIIRKTYPPPNLNS